MKFGRKILSIGLLALGAIIVFFLLQSTKYEIKNYPSDGTTIVAFGDSLIEGIGATQGNDFVSILSRRIGEPIVNLGVAGNTTAYGLARVDDVLDQHPKVVLILLGGNDFIQRVPENEVLNNLSRIITTIQDSGAVVILLGVQGGIIRDSYKKDFKRLARRHQTGYISNVLDGLIGDSRYMYDAIHPNDAGYRIIAERVLPILQELLQ